MFLICSFVDMMIFVFPQKGGECPFVGEWLGGGEEGGYNVVNYQCWFWGAREWVVSMRNCMYEVVSCASNRFQHPKEVVSHASY